MPATRFSDDSGSLRFERSTHGPISSGSSASWAAIPNAKQFQVDSSRSRTDAKSPSAFPIRQVESGVNNPRSGR